MHQILHKQILPMNFSYLPFITFFLLTLQVHAQNDSNLIYRKPLFDFNNKKPVFNFEKLAVTNRNRFLRYSALTGYREGVKPLRRFFASEIDTLSGTHRIYMYNLSIEDLFTHGLVTSNYVFLDVKDPSKYRWEPKYGPHDAWLRKNAYCYEFMMPIGVIKDIAIAEEDLAAMLSLKVSNEKRNVKTLILVRTSSKDKIKSLGIGKEKYDLKGAFNNTTLDRLSHPLFEAGMPPFIDETGYKGRVDLDLHVKSWSDIIEVRKELHRYDLDLKEETRPFEMLVIKEIN